MDFGIISLGNHAQGRVIPAILNAGSRVTHVYSTDRAKGERVSKNIGAEYCEDLEDFFRRSFEAVYISSPNSLHFTHARMAMEAGKFVLLEKPVTLRVEDTVALAELSAKRSLRFGIGFHLRFHPAVEDVKRILSSGQIGEVRAVFGKFSSNSVSSHDGTWWSDPTMAGGGSISGRGVHIFDSFVNLLGREVISVSASNLPKCAIVEDTMHATFLFQGGIVANSLSSRTMSADYNDLTIIGSEGGISVSNFYSTAVSSKLFVRGKLQKEYDGSTNMYVEEVKDFVKGGKRIAGPEDAVLSTKMHLYSQESACSGKTINFR